MNPKSVAPVAAFLLVVALPAYASELSTLKEDMLAARKELVTMVMNPGKRGPDQQKRVKDTADAVSAQLDRMAVPDGKADRFKELRATWDAFKHTRETELVPAILAGNKQEAEKIASGVQKERLERCFALISELDR